MRSYRDGLKGSNLKVISEREVEINVEPLSEDIQKEMDKILHLAKKLVK